MAELKDQGRIAGGKKAARTAKLRYGDNFHKDIGAKGGRSTATRHGEHFYEEIGRKGGRS